MYILVTKDFYDLKCKVDRTAGIALDIKDDARAKEIIKAGYARLLDVFIIEEKDVKADEPKKTDGKGKSKK